MGVSPPSLQDIDIELQDIDFQTNTVDFQSHGKYCLEDISHPWEVAFMHYSVRGVIYALIDILGNFSVILQPWNFCKVEFTYISSARETARKITKILQPSCF